MHVFKQTEMQTQKSFVTIYMTRNEAQILARILHKYHEVDTTMKELIQDDDEQHYFAQDLRDQLIAAIT